jgi:hypothetical protein
MYGDPNYWIHQHQGTNEPHDKIRTKRGISHKIKWDGKRETFQAYD